MSDYRMRVIHRDTGATVTWIPGAPVEHDLVEELVVRLKTRGVGWFRSEAKVVAAVREEYSAVLYELKRRV